MTRQEFSALTTEDLCDQLRRTYSGWESVWISVELVRRYLCGPPDYPGDPRSNCAVDRFQGVVGEVDGVTTEGYENKIWLPSDVELPECPGDIDVIIRNLVYYANEDGITGHFDIDYTSRLLVFTIDIDMTGEVFLYRRHRKDG